MNRAETARIENDPLVVQGVSLDRERVFIGRKHVADAQRDGRGSWFVWLPGGAPAYRGRPGRRMARAIRSAEHFAIR